MNSASTLKAMNAAPDAYTDIQGLQRLRNNPDKDAALKQVAQQFEAMFLNLLLKNMREANAVFEEDSPFSSNESHMVRDMYDNQLSLSMAQGKGTGLADALYRQMSGHYQTAPSSPADEAKPTADDWRRLREIIHSEAANVPGNTRSEANAAKAVDPAQRQALVDNPEEFVQKLLPHARAAAQQLGVDAEVLLAQAALETGWGRQVLADTNGATSHNLFNIKAKPDWRGDTVAVNALEFRDGVAVREQSQFKKYDSPAQSFADFVELVQNSPRYAQALAQAPEAEGFVNALHEAGYATDPNYANKVLAVYRELVESDKGAPATAFNGAAALAPADTTKSPQG